MNEGELNPRPESFDEKLDRDERRYDKGGVAAGKWLNRLVLVLVLVAVGYLAYGAAAAFFPRWWAQHVGDYVAGGRARGSLYGFGIGAVFTFVPVFLIAQARRGFFNWTWRAIVVLVAIIIALPNWLTIAVAIGTSSAAADGRAIMTSEAPGFRNGSAAGAIAGLLLALVVVGTGMRLGHRRRQVRELRDKVSRLEKKQFSDDSSEADRDDNAEGPDEKPDTSTDD